VDPGMISARIPIKVLATDRSVGAVPEKINLVRRFARPDRMWPPESLAHPYRAWIRDPSQVKGDSYRLKDQELNVLESN
jgi:hypothetical protein